MFISVIVVLLTSSLSS